MVEVNANWLPHLDGVVPIEASRKKVSMYTIALEGWRRGFTLKFYNNQYDNKLQIKYSLSYQGRMHMFDGSKGDKVSDEAVTICENKGLTNEYLAKKGVPIPGGKKFGPDIDDEEIVSFTKSLGFPVVLKPTNGCAGKGVIVNIQDVETLRESLEYVRRGLDFKEVIVEKFIPGDEVRIYVLGDRVLGAVKRIPANIVGDGIHTVKQLIKIKNEKRRKVPHLYYRPIKFDRDVKSAIEKAGLALDSIPKKGKRIFLKKVSNVSAGGDPVDVTSELTPEIKEIAIKATQAIPGLAHCGVDMIVNAEKNSGVVIELNTRPGIGSHLFPMEGFSKDIPKEIIDFYFPETKHISTESSKFFFDLKSIFEAFKSRSVSEIQVPPMPKGQLYAKKITINTAVNHLSFQQWVQSQACQRNLHGYVKEYNEDVIEIVVGTTIKEDLDEFIKLITEKLSDHGKQTIKEEYWDKPIKIGFEIVDELSLMNIGDIEEELKNIEKELQSLEREKERFLRKAAQIQQSRTWRYTEPIRKIADILKNIFQKRFA